MGVYIPPPDQRDGDQGEAGLRRETKLLRQRAEPSDDILNATKQIAEVTNGYKGNFNNFRPVPSNGLNLCRFGRRCGGPYAMRQGVPFSPCIVDLRQQLEAAMAP